MRKKAFVTGGTGFIGINLLKLLLQEGWEIVALHRSTSDLSELKKLPVSLTVGSVTNLDSLHSSIPQDTSVVFHLAGDTNIWSKQNKQQYEVNVTGTKNMVIAAAEKNVDTFIHTSSIAAWGNITGVVTEQTPQRGGNSWVNYERTKWAGEREALKGLEHGMKVIILNPSAVTGPHDNNNWGRLFTALKEGTIPAVSSGCLSIAHVQEVARAHISAVDNGQTGERYILGGENCSVKDLVEMIARISGISQTPAEIPRWLFMAYGQLQETISKVTGNKPKLTPELVKVMTRQNISFSSKKAIKHLGYEIPPLEKTVTDCYEWLKKEGII
ncbi:MAG: SDR family oxidoreductase [Balneolaceae bacterium]|nr:SDR family oxidoreductase [Balneolaceae bacterium]